MFAVELQVIGCILCIRAV